MRDYTYPSIIFAYVFFAILAGLAVFFFARTLRQGYWGKDSEDVKFKMLEDDDTDRRLP
ncbi:MAG: hypothetical protein LWX11_00085 [Firmicutes bacterium]|nr:hypothetical protein [Bacillota bacterium]